MLMIFPKESLSLRMTLRCLHDNLSSPSVEKLLQLVIALLNSSLEKEAYEEGDLSATSSRILISTWRWRAVLNIKWSIFHKSSMVKYSWLLYLIASMAGNLHLLTQLMSSQGPCFLLAISWILRSKKDCLEDLTVFLKIF